MHNQDSEYKLYPSTSHMKILDVTKYILRIHYILFILRLLVSYTQNSNVLRRGQSHIGEHAPIGISMFMAINGINYALFL